ncbi:MAG: pirin family protein [Alphaproteobacteria bacterium]|nr:pirin family protein [Alphaproteobacteria bacterium]
MSDPVLATVPLGFQWPTLDPFLFCVHHDDAYPRGDGALAPAASLAGRDLGSDFQVRDGWRMYHGRTIPGFPSHPHRGFETVTVVRRGLVDHADSLGAAARYGRGDVQWMTAGRGIQHAEMFPLVHQDRDNPLELFQIWLNLPAADKMVDPSYTMLWAPDVPTLRLADAQGRETELEVIAGAFGGARPPAPPPDSWASKPDSDVAIWTLRMAPDATFTLPPAGKETGRVLYLFDGDGVRVADRHGAPKTAFQLRGDAAVTLQNGPAESQLLLLQGRPIGEPVAQQGPFVMNTRAELQQAYTDYQRTRFGGWPWDRSDPTHGDEDTRFARHADGRVERPKAS